MRFELTMLLVIGTDCIGNIMMMMMGKYGKYKLKISQHSLLSITKEMIFLKNGKWNEE
jgi:hypothetical protein